jgi:hypothetical protein
VFSVPSDSEVANIASEFRPLTESQIRSVVGVTLAQLAIESSPRIVRALPQLVAEYRSGVDIVDIANRHRTPPIATLRAILIEIGYSAAVVYDTLTRRVDPATRLRPPDLRAFEAAEAADAGNAVAQREITARAAHEESRFVSALRTLGLRLRTQEDLAREQTAEYGRAVITPDVLFDQPVFVNGVRTNWIDFKAYLLVPGTFIARSLTRQCDKYNAYYGPGAFAFLYGYIAAPNLRTVLLDARSMLEYCEGGDSRTRDS